MDSFLFFVAILGIVLAIVLLIKQVETKTVFIGVGFILCLISLKPMSALSAFTEAMTQAALLKAICSSMGFAFVMKYTQCDRHLVKFLTAPLKNIGFFLIPLSYCITFFVSIAIPSAAGCSAAVGTTLIPLLMASGVRPAMAGASVLSGTLGGILSPGVSHSIFIAEMTKKSIPEIISIQLPNALVCAGIMIIGLMVMAVVLKDYQKNETVALLNDEPEIQRVKFFHAIMPLVPLVFIIIGATSISLQFTFLHWLHNIGVAEAMLLGAIIAIVATRTNPVAICKEFFSGMGNSYANIIGIIVAASVFVAGLKACGMIDIVIEWLKNDTHFVRIGGTFIPFIMAALTGSGDATAMAFNGAITIHAEELGFNQAQLGATVAMSAVVGRYMSPLLGACILVAGLAKTTPLEIVKRTALGCIVSVSAIAFILI